MIVPESSLFKQENSCPEDVRVETLWRNHLQALNKIIETTAKPFVQSVLNKQVLSPKASFIVKALIYAILTTSPNKARQALEYVIAVPEESHKNIKQDMNWVISRKFYRLEPKAQEQVLWFMEELIIADSPFADQLLYSVVRQIQGGRVTKISVKLSNNLMDLVEKHRRWFLSHEVLAASVIYTLLRLIENHTHKELQKVKEREISVVVPVIKEIGWEKLGRDGVRVLLHLQDIPIMREVLNELQRTDPTSKKLTLFQVLTTPTDPMVISSRIPPVVSDLLGRALRDLPQKNLQDITTKIRTEYLTGNAKEYYAMDIIRYLLRVFDCSKLPPKTIRIHSLVAFLMRARWSKKKGSTNTASEKRKRFLVLEAILFDLLHFSMVDDIRRAQPVFNLLKTFQQPQNRDIAIMLIEQIVSTLTSANYPYSTSVSPKTSFPRINDFLITCIQNAFNAARNAKMFSIQQLYKSSFASQHSLMLNKFKHTLPGLQTLNGQVHNAPFFPQNNNFPRMYSQSQRGAPRGNFFPHPNNRAVAPFSHNHAPPLHFLPGPSQGRGNFGPNPWFNRGRNLAYRGRGRGNFRMNGNFVSSPHALNRRGNLKTNHLISNRSNAPSDTQSTSLSSVPPPSSPPVRRGNCTAPSSPARRGIVITTNHSGTNHPISRHLAAQAAIQSPNETPAPVRVNGSSKKRSLQSNESNRAPIRKKQALSKQLPATSKQRSEDATILSMPTALGEISKEYLEFHKAAHEYNLSLQKTPLDHRQVIAIKLLENLLEKTTSVEPSQEFIRCFAETFCNTIGFELKSGTGSRWSKATTPLVETFLKWAVPLWPEEDDGDENSFLVLIKNDPIKEKLLQVLREEFDSWGFRILIYDQMQNSAGFENLLQFIDTSDHVKHLLSEARNARAHSRESLWTLMDHFYGRFYKEVIGDPEFLIFFLNSLLPSEISSLSNQIICGFIDVIPDPEDMPLFLKALASQSQYCQQVFWRLTKYTYQNHPKRYDLFVKCAQFLCTTPSPPGHDSPVLPPTLKEDTVRSWNWPVAFVEGLHALGTTAMNHPECQKHCSSFWRIIVALPNTYLVPRLFITSAILNESKILRFLKEIVSSLHPSLSLSLKKRSKKSIVGDLEVLATNFFAIMESFSQIKAMESSLQEKAVTLFEDIELKKSCEELTKLPKFKTHLKIYKRLWEGEGEDNIFDREPESSDELKVGLRRKRFSDDEVLASEELRCRKRKKRVTRPSDFSSEEEKIPRRGNKANDENSWRNIRTSRELISR